jgi:putative Holliday junction resolvase
MRESWNAAPGRVLALDVGARRIGLAVSDQLGITAQGLETLERTNLREDFARLALMVREHGVTRLLIGNPVNMGGSEGRQSAWVREFAGKLQERTGLEVVLWDERLTTVEAQRVLRASGVSREKRARAVDRLSAVLLLESYLDSITSREAGGDGPA